MFHEIIEGFWATSARNFLGKKATKIFKGLAFPVHRFFGKHSQAHHLSKSIRLYQRCQKVVRWMASDSNIYFSFFSVAYTQLLISICGFLWDLHNWRTTLAMMLLYEFSVQESISFFA